MVQLSVAMSCYLRLRRGFDQQRMRIWVYSYFASVLQTKLRGIVCLTMIPVLQFAELRQGLMQ
ncbi:hypothetical protein DEH81_15020 [Pectobacterium zantedeschiae]|nr:hypothetical protein DEH81_15020 [Pectobacterium zantedeschiae]